MLRFQAENGCNRHQEYEVGCIVNRFNGIATTTRDQVAEQIRYLRCVDFVTVGGHHVAVHSDGRRIGMVTGTYPDWR